MIEQFFGPTPHLWNGGVPFAAVAPSPPVQVPMAPDTMGYTQMAAAPTASAIVVTVAMRRGQPSGPATDTDIEEFLYDALEFLSGTTDVEVRCENGRVTLAGTVPHKRQKRDIGEIAWAIPATNDVQNNLAIAARRRGRSGARETESAGTGARKPA